MMLVFLLLYLNLSGVFNTSYGNTFQFSFYTAVVFVALAIGLGIQHSYEDDGTITPLAWEPWATLGVSFCRNRSQ